MPRFGDLLDDQQVAEVVGFSQTHWGNEAEIEASADLVEAIRQ
jgi:mono/diheme cytochrome c family protein